eukprot:CAMPEP_0170062148 /NCGR_PEP_ID=MMETSP0019_2-20121128/3478_1 /TAXON_ID=98059 /ORGANISM="Dinobryon sp., Strain UTEXLB2267" /LENGTH=490 /DNA_ID=CAMNT_0010268213 /DNA_START=1126 /DNA_END=2593 /DNA_ORIENTATION=-
MSDYSTSPSTEQRERVNDGNTLNLGGIGFAPLYVMNATLLWCSLAGLVLKDTYSKDIYLITPLHPQLLTTDTHKRLFFDWTAFSQRGFLSSHILIAPGHLLGLLPSGPPLLPLCNSTTNSSGCPHGEEEEVGPLQAARWQALSTCDGPAQLRAAKQRMQLTVDSPSRHHAALWGLPVTVSLQHPVQTHPHLPICISGEAPGRWVRLPLCDPSPSLSWQRPGHICRHCLDPVLDGLPYSFTHQAKGYVWRPLHCRLVAFQPVRASRDFCGTLLSVPADPAVPVPAEGEGSVSLLALVPALRRGGAGGGLRGQSGQRDGVALLGLDRATGWDWLGCANSGRQKLHRLRVESAEEPSALVSCIETTVAQRWAMLNTTNTMSNTMNGSVFRFEEVLLVTNFMSQHSVWLMTLSDIRLHLQRQAEQHQRLAQRLLSLFGLRYRRVFFSAVAVHGGGLTPARQMWLNRQAAELLGRSGWEMLYVDGVHYRGGVSVS